MYLFIVVVSSSLSFYFSFLTTLHILEENHKKKMEQHKKLVESKLNLNNIKYYKHLEKMYSIEKYNAQVIENKKKYFSEPARKMKIDFSIMKEVVPNNEELTPSLKKYLWYTNDDYLHFRDEYNEV